MGNWLTAVSGKNHYRKNFPNKNNIYTITPSWLVKRKQEFVRAIRNLEKLGFEVINKNFVTRLLSPEEKAQQIHSAFLNKKVDIILAQRGGYSSIKVLPYLNFDIIKKNPKIFAGFSDLSAMLNAIYERTGIITLHSPMLINFAPLRKLTVESFLNAINHFPDKNLFSGLNICVYKHGIEKGILKGGNLITLTSLLGTQWEIDTNHTVLFFEEVDEKLHKIDRCITQWILAGKFKKIKGLILGDFRGIGNREIYKILSSQTKINYPVVQCSNIGHVKNKITLPIGARVELDTYKKSLFIN